MPFPFERKQRSPVQRLAYLELVLSFVAMTAPISVAKDGEKFFVRLSQGGRQLI